MYYENYLIPETDIDEESTSRYCYRFTESVTYEVSCIVKIHVHIE